MSLAVAALSASQIKIDLVDIDRDSCRKALDNYH